VTVGKLRRLFPDLFDVEGAGHREFFSANAYGRHNRSEEEWLAAMLSAERYLARHAFELACGKTSTCLTRLGDTRDESAAELGKYYIHFGLASGPQHADQLIRAFETQAAAQGRTPENPVPPTFGR